MCVTLKCWSYMPGVPESPAPMNVPDRSAAYKCMHGLKSRIADEKNEIVNNITHLNDFFKA